MVIEDDEIAIIARVTMALGDGCQDAIDYKIAKALSESQWDDMNKWHRVRLRIGRMQREMIRRRSTRLASAQLAFQ
ncbi:MAG: hypothetical protein ABIO86_10275 [Sphingomonas sp.]